MVKAAYLFLDPDADPKKHRALVETPTVSVTIIAIKDFDEGANIAKSLVEEGIQDIELCGGWGAVGCAKIIEAVSDKIPVGSVFYGLRSATKVLALFPN